MIFSKFYGNSWLLFHLIWKIKLGKNGVLEGFLFLWLFKNNYKNPFYWRKGPNMAWCWSLNLLSAAPIGGGGANLAGLLMIGFSTSMANWSCGWSWRWPGCGLATTCCSSGRWDRSSKIDNIMYNKYENDFRNSVSTSNGTTCCSKAKSRSFPTPTMGSIIHWSGKANH